MFITQYLYFNVTRVVDELLDQHPTVPETGQGFLRGQLEPFPEKQNAQQITANVCETFAGIDNGAVERIEPGQIKFVQVHLRSGYLFNNSNINFIVRFMFYINNALVQFVVPTQNGVSNYDTVSKIDFDVVRTEII